MSARYPWVVPACISALLAGMTLAIGFDRGAIMAWIPNGFLVPWLLHRGRDEWRGTALACWLATAGVSAMFGNGWMMIGLTALSMAECLVTAELLRRWLGQSHYLDSLKHLSFFVLAATIVPAIGAQAAGLIITSGSGRAFMPAATSWFISHALGVILFGPFAALMLRWQHTPHTRQLNGRRVRNLLLWLAPVALITGGVFSQSVLPLLFFPIVPMTVATLRLGRFGAIGSVVILAIVGNISMRAGDGPLMLLHLSPAHTMHFLQFYLASVAAILLPIAVVMRQRRILTDRLAASEHALRIITDNSGDALLYADAEGRIVQATGSLEALIGRGAGWLIGRHATELVVTADRSAIARAHFALLKQPGETANFEYRARMRDGSDRWFESRARAVVGRDGRPTGTVSAIRDIDARKRTETELQLAASTDGLTGLLNRRAFYSYFETTVAQGQGGVLIIADLDHFKSINDRFGHHVGDTVLQDFARLAEGVLRPTDVVARIGGEEFAFFMPAAELDQGYALCKRLRTALATAGQQNDKAARRAVTASMGMVAVAATDTAADALRRADSALYAAKEAGRDCLRLAA